uniref:Uncharacterized protein n=1 Tax=Leersia perrieri TaxID=77586 RepID=A0A0D9VEX2_9ORYZ
MRRLRTILPGRVDARQRTIGCRRPKATDPACRARPIPSRAGDSPALSSRVLLFSPQISSPDICSPALVFSPELVRRDVHARRSLEEERIEDIGCGGDSPMPNPRCRSGRSGGDGGGGSLIWAWLVLVPRSAVVLWVVVSGYHRRPILADALAGEWRQRRLSRLYLSEVTSPACQRLNLGLMRPAVIPLLLDHGNP